MDEVHYLADRFRGAVWEEVIIHLPESVRVVSLSATVSNAEEFGDWLAEVRGDTGGHRRRAPSGAAVAAHARRRGGCIDLFTDDDQREVNPDLVRLARPRVAPAAAPAGRDRGDRRRAAHRAALPPRGRRPARPRRGCCPRSPSSSAGPAATPPSGSAWPRACGSTTTATSARIIDDVAARRTADLPDEDLAVLGYCDWRRRPCARASPPITPALLPAFKEVVEELFTAGLVRAVFATETLALGINMPARTVVLEKLDKWNGEAHARLTPGEYTQLTGRAGRRGIDVEGHAVVLWQPGLDPGAVAGLARTRTYPLSSSFRPSYNMAVNLIAQVGRTRGRRAARVELRPVPGRPGRRRPGAAAAPPPGPGRRPGETGQL